MSDLAARIIEAARSASVTLATAESLTGGLVCEALVAVPGASAVVRGGIVAYDADVKRSALGVSQALLDAEGPVSQSVATAMARGALRQLGADVAVATTGVAGPEPHGGHAPGTVVIAVVSPRGDKATTLHFEGDRDAVRQASAHAALEHLLRAVSVLPHSQ